MNSPPSWPTFWKAAEVALATGGRAQGEWIATGVSIDSRSIAAGDLFVALKGPNFDGHDFVKDALAKGAAAVMVERLPKSAANAPAVTVDDTLAGLTDLGAAGRARAKAKIVGITGSVGKTGTKQALAHALSGQGRVHASFGSLNNHWGVPLSLARMPADCDYGVLEMGMNHPGEIRGLTALVRPHVAVITAIAEAHLEQMKTLENIAKAKAEILEGLPDGGGVAVLPRDSEFFDLLRECAGELGVSRILSFGEHKNADIRLLECSLYSRCSAVSALIRGEPLEYCLALPGKHWVLNSLAVLAAVVGLDADPIVAARSFARLEAPKGRGERHRIALPGGEAQVIDDSYNANPTSMRAAIAVLAGATPPRGGRRILALGDMLELGENADELHASLAEPIDDADIDLVFTCGPRMAALNAALPHFRRAEHSEDSQALARRLAASLRAGDLVLVKGSAGSRMGRVVEALKALGRDDPHGDIPRAANGG
jgi:UDP-N-acetylmuramoyl-tripeptide--D-alanyl-D-alanine ligase